MKRIFCLCLIGLLLFNTVYVNALSVSANCAVLIDADTGKILFAKNEQTKASMASTTKIMTALLLCENKELTEKIEITNEMVRVEGTSMGLKAGDIVTYNDLLYGMLLPSGNDAANAAAIGISGSIKAFVALMNSKAKELGLKNTSFETPSGLDGEEHYTTAFELALITKEALKNNAFAKACATKSITLEYGGAKHTLTNHNRLLNMNSSVVGVKTGFTKKSGRCLVSAAKKNGITLIAVTLNDKDDWNDHNAMLEYGFSVSQSKTVDFQTQEYNVPVISGESDFITVKSEAVSFQCNSEADVVKTVYLEKFVYAPVNQNEKLGCIEYTLGGKVIARQELLAENGVALAKPPAAYKIFIKNLFLILGEVI